MVQIEDILRKASEIFSRIAQETLAIRNNHKEIDIPESIYDGQRLENFDDDHDFDEILLDSKAYKEAFKEMARNRQNSIVDPNSGGFSLRQLETGTSSRSPVLHRVRSKDILTGQAMEDPVLPSEMSVRHTLIGTEDTESDLIDLSDDVGPQNDQKVSDQTTSPGLAQLEGLDFGFVHPIAAKNPENHGKSLEPSNQEEMNQNAIHSPLKDRTTRTLDERRDSALTNTKRGSEVPSIIEPEEKIVNVLPIQEEKIVNVLPAPEGKIVVPKMEVEEKILVTAEELAFQQGTLGFHHGSRASSSSRPTSTSTSGADMSPLSGHSPLTSEYSFPSIHRLSNPPPNVPPADDYHQNELLQNMRPCMSGSDQNQQLDWAEDALRHCYLCQAHEARINRTQRARESVPEAEKTMYDVASQFIDTMLKTGNGRAYFIKARYLAKSQGTKRDNYILASSNGYHRAHYYLGRMYEAEKSSTSVSEAVRRYRSGANENDAACLYVGVYYFSPAQC
jgi:hypothetical protein